jgi:hypothetical protein
MARQALRKLVPGRIEFRPVERDGERGYDLRWSLVTKAILNGNIGVASPRGFGRDITAFASRIELPLTAWQQAA